MDPTWSSELGDTVGFTAPRKALLLGPVFQSLQGNYRVIDKAIQLKILIYRIFLLFFLDYHVASLLAMTVQISTQAIPACNDDSVLMKQGLQNEQEIHFLNSVFPVCSNTVCPINCDRTS